MTSECNSDLIVVVFGMCVFCY